MERRVDLAPQTRRADVAKDSAGTVHGVFTTGARMPRVMWTGERFEDVMEELSTDPAHVRLDRANGGSMAVSNSHKTGSALDQIGVVESARMVDGKGVMTIRPSDREDAKPFWHDKYPRGVSFGYRVYRYERLEPDAESEGLPIMRAVDYEPFEISLVVVPADPGAQLTTRADGETNHCIIITEDTMTTTTTSGTGERSAVQIQREHLTLIRTLVSQHNLERSFEDTLIADSTLTADQVRARVLDKVATRQEENVVRSGLGDIETVSDETVNRREAVRDALLLRYDPNFYHGNAREPQLVERARPWGGMSQREIIRALLVQRGVRAQGMSVHQMWERTFGSSGDYPNIVLDVANKALRRAYEAAPRTFVPFSREVSAPDFKNINRVSISDAPGLNLVRPGGEFTRGTMQDAKQVYALKTYGRVVGINRQTIINDDLDAFTRIPALFGRAAADLESDTVWGIITANGTLNDGVAVFSTAATRLNNTTGVTAISVDNLGVARAAIRKQTNLQGRPINAAPRYLIVPATLESLAEQYTSANYQATQASGVNPFGDGRSVLTPIAEPRLDTTSTSTWYLSADPSQVDTLEYCYLDGQRGVFIESRMGFDIDGIEIKAREDFAAAAIDHRGLYKFGN